MGTGEIEYISTTIDALRIDNSNDMMIIESLSTEEI